MKNILFYLSLVFIFISCENATLSDINYVQYVNNPNNGLFDYDQEGKYKISLQYLPWQYVALQNYSKNLEYSQNEYYLLKIERKDGSQFPDKNMLNDNEYRLMMEYFAFDFNESIFLIEEKDTLRVNSFHFENNYGMTPYLSFLFSFPSSNKNRDKYVYLDSDFLSINETLLFIDRQSIIKIPELKK